ncbi:ABC transporter substrate-binding protein [Peribacillus butanolivorans]|uniref:ABC transporter substrate-binding protein n=1 Tax=Peribacillus butanolivorans TaxID=421767 RepID=UPI00365B58D1
MKNFIRILGLLGLVFLITACSSSKSSEPAQNGKTGTAEDKVEDGTPQKGGEATLAYYSDVSNFDPILGSSGSDHSLLWPIFDTLIKFTPDLKAAPGLAEKWEFLDEKTLLLTLREGVTFHDGTPFDAEAVKFNIERINSDKSKIPDLKNVVSVEVVDEKTVKFNLLQPDSSILLALSDRGGMMVSPTAVKEMGEDFAHTPVGAGPFKMVSRIPNGEIVYEAYENYYEEGQPYLDKMTIKVMVEENTRINALKSGEVDFVFDIKPGNVKTLESDQNIKLDSITPVRFRTIFLNTAMEPLNNKAVRQAIQYGINRKEIIQAINFESGEPANQPFPSGYWATDEKLKIDYDPEKAKAILKDAGIKNVSFDMVYQANAVNQRLSEAIKGQLEKIGIKVNIKGMELTASSTHYFTDKAINANLQSWTGRPDPQMTINNLFSADSFFNPGGTSTDEIEELISQAASTNDQKERVKIYKQVSQKGIIEEAMIIPIFFEPQTAAMKKSIHGYESNLLGKPIFSTIWKE